MPTHPKASPSPIGLHGAVLLAFLIKELEGERPDSLGDVISRVSVLGTSVSKLGRQERSLRVVTCKGSLTLPLKPACSVRRQELADLGGIFLPLSDRRRRSGSAAGKSVPTSLDAVPGRGGNRWESGAKKERWSGRADLNRGPLGPEPNLIHARSRPA